MQALNNLPNPGVTYGGLPAEETRVKTTNDAARLRYKIYDDA